MTYPPEPWTLTGRLDASTFLVPAAELGEVAPPAGHRLLLVGGRAVVTVAWVDYDDRGVMSYRELLATVATRAGTAVRPHITDIWVDSPSSRDGGRGLWGIPKGLAEFDAAAPGADPADGVRSCTPEGADRPVATATIRRGRPWPVRLPVGFAVAQHPGVAGLAGPGALVSPVATRAGVGSATLRWEFDPDGPLGRLAGRRPMSSLALHGFSMRFGLTAPERARERGTART